LKWQRLWVRKYLDEARPQLATEPDDRTVFLSNAGQTFSLDHLSDLVRGHVEASNIGKQGACYLFRHTMATLMLEGGADIRQPELGAVAAFSLLVNVTVAWFTSRIGEARAFLTRLCVCFAETFAGAAFLFLAIIALHSLGVRW
jgi:hypothetical protein